MKHYHDQKIELQLAKYRLEGLKERRRLLFDMTQPKASDIAKDRIQTNNSINVYDGYVCRIEDIDKTIALVEKDIETIQNYLNVMEKALRQTKGSLTKIFVMRYIDGLTVSEIHQRTSYSPSSIYRKLTKISKILKDDKK